MSKEFHPLVSIVIPVYNGANYMREAIDSALAQTYSNIEILVINDGSTDDGATHDIAMSYGEKIRYFQKENGGVVSALNFGIENMRGEYFAWLSHDDLYLPEKIEKQVLALKRHKGSRPAFCVCNCRFINENGQEMYKSYVCKDCSFNNPRCFLFLGNVGFNGIMVLIPKVLFDICGGFTPSLATHEYDMWLRIMDVADVVVEPECLTCMRLHSDQVTSQKKLDVTKEVDNFIAKGVKEIPNSDFQAFVVDQIDEKGIEYFYQMLNSYMWFQNFPFTSVQTLKQLRLMFEKPTVQIDHLYSFLCGHSEIKEIKNYFIQRINNDRPLIIIYCENVTDDLFKGISTGIALLSTQYEIVLFYQTIETYHLQLLNDVNITSIKLASHLDINMPLRLGVLSFLLNAKLFWYYCADNNMQYSQVFHYLTITEIYSIASFHDIDKVFINARDVYNINYIDQKKHMSKASLITSRVFPSASGSLCFQNMIIVTENDLKALARWKMIFDVLLSTTNFCELENRINNGLSTIIEKMHSSADYVNNYIRGFLLELDRKTIILINSYEQRRFWKLTRPIRFCVCFFRKANKFIKRNLKQKKSFRSVIYHLKMMLKNRRIPV